MAVVLVVDDDAAWREVVLETLQAHGFDAVGAVNGLDALLRLRRREVWPDVITLDLSMPVLDGWEFRARQLADPGIAGIPVVVVSGDDPGALRAARRLSKPCTPGELVLAVNEVAGSRRAA